MKPGTKTLCAAERCLVSGTAGEHLPSHTKRKDKKPAPPVFFHVAANAVLVSFPSHFY